MIKVRVHPTEVTAGRDANGDFITAPKPPYDIEVYSVYPRTSTEGQDANRDLVVNEWTILAPETATVSETAQIDIHLDGVLWDVDGEPRLWDARSNPLRRGGFLWARVRFPTRRVGCLEINVRRADG